MYNTEVYFELRNVEDICSHITDAIVLLIQSCFSPNTVKTRSDPTSDEPTTDAVETTAAEAVLTDYRESVEGQQH